MAQSVSALLGRCTPQARRDCVGPLIQPYSGPKPKVTRLSPVLTQPALDLRAALEGLPQLEAPLRALRAYEDTVAMLGALAEIEDDFPLQQFGSVTLTRMGEPVFSLINTWRTTAGSVDVAVDMFVLRWKLAKKASAPLAPTA